MSDDRIVDLETSRKAGHVRYRDEGPKTATCTHAVPSECPDAPHVRLDGLRKPTGKPTALPADLAPMGLDPASWPFTGDARRRELRELHQRLDSALVTAGETEQAILQAASLLERAARMNVLVRGEIDTLSRRIAEMGGDDNPPKGAA